MRANGFSEADIRGALAYEETFDRIRRLLRAGPAGDTLARALAQPRARSRRSSATTS